MGWSSPRCWRASRRRCTFNHREDEAFWILEGQLTMRCGKQELSLGAGSFVLLPRDVPHTFLVEGDTPARILTLLTPGGSEAFFAVAGRTAESADLPAAAPPDIAALSAAAQQFEIEILGPPMRPMQPGFQLAR